MEYQGYFLCAYLFWLKIFLAVRRSCAFHTRDMSKKAIIKKTRGAPKKIVKKIKRNVSLAPIENRMAEALALADGRSVSDYLGRTIREKHEAFKARKGAKQ